MIQNFRHRGLRLLYEQDDGRRIKADQRERIRDILFHLDQACVPGDLNLPGYRLHPLKGQLRGLWSVTVSGNWRITFRLQDEQVFDVDLVDYH